MRSTEGEQEAMDRIYRLAWRWATDVLPNGDSILTPGSRIWTVQNFDELQVKFVERPDETGDKKFLAKLHEQLSDASPAAIQLMAELHLLFFWWVWEGAISAPKKRADLNAILSWHPDRPTIPAEVDASLSPGIAHPGQWANTRRDVQLTCLVHVAMALKSQSPDRYAELLRDPFQFRDVVVATPDSSADAAKLGLLHLLFPDTFEHTVSPRHKQLILSRFNGHVRDETDMDRALLQIRQALSSTYGPCFDYYAAETDPLPHLWNKDRAWTSVVRWVQRIWTTMDLDAEERNYKLDFSRQLKARRHNDPVGVVEWYESLRKGLFDPNNNLMGWRSRATFDAWAKANPEDARRAVESLWGNDSRSESERVDQFASLIRPAGLTTMGPAVKLASVLLMADDPEVHPPVKVEKTRKAWRLAGWGNEPQSATPGGFVTRAYAFFDELVRDSAGWEQPLRDRLDAQGALWTLTSLDKRPEAWTEKEWQLFLAFQDGVLVDPDDEPEPTEAEDDPEPVLTRDFIAEAAEDLHVDRTVLDEIVTLLEDKGQVVLYCPPGTGKTYLAKRLAAALVEEDPARTTVVQFHPATTYEDFFEGLRPTLDGGTVAYELRRGPLSLLAKAAIDDPDRPHVMVIDELNRANLPKVFGELLFLLEYRDVSVATLYRPQEKFILPPNLFFIATMNTADRSVALVDAALRRRFHFIPFFPHLGAMKGLLRRWLTDHSRSTAVADMLDAINDELRVEVGDHLVIGPSHFMKEDLSEQALQRIWEYNIYPTLEELLWGRTEELVRWRWPEVRDRYATELRLHPAHAQEEDGTQASDPAAAR
ncbi:AAA family ATPase [Propioniciclava sinopodophylli]|uniref:AAA family ATPase n=1 Tax=Propioniciclava sinopodophylli TaxID=1837344 RepID=A0A4V2JSD3_9ACTN|nr:AAA family ATPase [Propioniciclava sinopodophylli]TBT84008.1 AAA family ATPase [Propioniciclava sinopodophylli]